MLSAPDPAPSPLKPRQRWLPRPRFSLRTLVIAVLLIASGGGLWWRWEPWVVTWTLEGLNPRIFSTFLSHKRDLILVNRYGGSADIWNVAKKTVVARLPDAHGLFVYASFSPDDSKVITHVSMDEHCSQDYETKIWEVSTGKLLSTWDGALKGRYGTYLDDGKTILLEADKDNPPECLDSETLVSKFKMPGHTGGIFQYAVDKNCKLLVTVSADHTARAWDLTNGSLLSVFSGHTNQVIEVAISPDSKTIATGSWDGTARLWNPNTGKELFCFRHPSSVSALDFSEDGRFVSSGSFDGTACVWDAKSGEPVSSCIFDMQVHKVEFCSDGRRIFTTGSKGRNLDIWDVHSGEKLCLLKIGDGTSPRFRLVEDGNVLYADAGFPLILHRRRPEYWWGLAWLPEFWLTAVFAAVLVWSVWRDRKRTDKTIT